MGLLSYQMARCIDSFIQLQNQGAMYSQFIKPYYDTCPNFYTSLFKYLYKNQLK